MHGNLLNLNWFRDRDCREWLHRPCCAREWVWSALLTDWPDWRRRDNSLCNCTNYPSAGRRCCLRLKRGWCWNWGVVEWRERGNSSKSGWIGLCRFETRDWWEEARWSEDGREPLILYVGPNLLPLLLVKGKHTQNKAKNRLRSKILKKWPQMLGRTFRILNRRIISSLTWTLFWFSRIERIEWYVPLKRQIDFQSSAAFHLNGCWLLLATKMQGTPSMF